MAVLCKYEKQQRYASYDNGQTWQPLQEFQVGNLVEFGSEDCGSSESYRWVKIDNDFLCVGKDKYTKYIYQVSYDDVHWYNVFPTQYRAGELVESNSEFCDNAIEAHYVIGSTDCTSSNGFDPVWVIKCDESGTVITRDDIRKNGQCLRSVTINDCVDVISDNAFSYQCLTSLTIPNSVTYIGDNAFQQNGCLITTTIGSGVTYIGDEAFDHCVSLSNIEIPDSVSYIGDYAFWHCDSLSSITIGSGVTYIGEEAFLYSNYNNTIIICKSTTPPTISDVYKPFNLYNTTIYVPCESVNAYKTAWPDYANRIQCQSPTPSTPKWIATYTGGTTSSAECDSTSAITSHEISKQNLVSVDVGDCVTSIELSAFTYNSTISRVNISDSVTSIWGYAFYACYNLSSVTIGSGVTSIDSSAFEGCTSLTNIEIPSAAKIGTECFFRCRGLTNVTIPNGVISINDRAFNSCSGLTSITIPSGSISGSNVFTDCTSLSSVTIGSGVTEIGSFTFYGCTSLTSVTVEATTPPTFGTGVFTNASNCPIYVPSASVNAYKAASGWSRYADRIYPIPNS